MRIFTACSLNQFWDSELILASHFTCESSSRNDSEYRNRFIERLLSDMSKGRLISSIKLTIATGKEQRSPEILFEEFDKSLACQHITQTVPKKDREAAKCREISLFMTPLEMEIWLTIDVWVRTYDYDKTRKLMVTKFNELQASTRNGEWDFIMTDKCIENVLSEEALYDRFILPGESHRHYANELKEIADELLLPESEAVQQFIKGVDTETRQGLIALGKSEKIQSIAELMIQVTEVKDNTRKVRSKKNKKKRQVAEFEVKKRAFWEAERRELHSELKDRLGKLKIEKDVIMRAEDSLNIIIEPPPPVEETDPTISHSNSFAIDGLMTSDEAIRRALTDEVLNRQERKQNRFLATEDTREPQLTAEDDDDESLWVDIDSDDAGSSVWNSVLPKESTSSSSLDNELQARTVAEEHNECPLVMAKLPDDYQYEDEVRSPQPRPHSVLTAMKGTRKCIEPPWYNILHAKGLYEECLRQQKAKPKKASGWPLRAPMKRPKKKDNPKHRSCLLREGQRCRNEKIGTKKASDEERLSVYMPIDYSEEKKIAEGILKEMNILKQPRLEHTFGRREGNRLLSVLPAL